jgi:hypothetical protein
VVLPAISANQPPIVVDFIRMLLAAKCTTEVQMWAPTIDRLVRVNSSLVLVIHGQR